VRFAESACRTNPGCGQRGKADWNHRRAGDPRSRERNSKCVLINPWAKESAVTDPDRGAGERDDPRLPGGARDTPGDPAVPARVSGPLPGRPARTGEFVMTIRRYAGRPGWRIAPGTDPAGKAKRLAGLIAICVAAAGLSLPAISLSAAPPAGAAWRLTPTPAGTAWGLAPAASTGTYPRPDAYCAARAQSSPAGAGLRTCGNGHAIDLSGMHAGHGNNHAPFREDTGSYAHSRRICPGLAMRATPTLSRAKSAIM
jgi:hypothetical protein